jgi:hypothetical protein
MNLNHDSRFLNHVIRNLVLVLFAAFCFSGCAYGTRMALDANKGNLAKMTKPIGMFTLRTENVFKPSYQPEVNRIRFVSSASQKEKTFQPGKPYKQAKNEFLEYLVSVDLESGDYSLKDIKGTSSGFFVAGTFGFPVNARLKLNNGITYLGHITMTNHERKEGEERSGSVFPLVDNAVCGFSSGTFDVKVSDRGETDIPDFVQAYPALKDVNIAKAIMEK